MDTFIETTANTVLAAVLLLVTCYIYFTDPVAYVLLIAEDHYGEYATMAGFLVAGLLLIASSLRDGPAFRRSVWAMMGVAALVIAAEEISWGQRLLGLEGPDAIVEANFQGEITLHNLRIAWGLMDRLYAFGGYVILAWLALSVIVSIWFPSIKERLHAVGLPIIPLTLVPLFLLTPFFLLSYPIAKSEEIAEATLALAVAAWAAHLFARAGKGRPRTRRAAAGLTVTAFLVIGAISVIMTSQLPGSSRALSWRINKTAVRDYPSFGLYEQALTLFGYIHAHPELIRPETQKNYEDVRRLAASAVAQEN